MTEEIEEIEEIMDEDEYIVVSEADKATASKIFDYIWCNWPIEMSHFRFGKAERCVELKVTTCLTGGGKHVTRRDYHVTHTDNLNGVLEAIANCFRNGYLTRTTDLNEDRLIIIGNKFRA